MKLVKMGMVLSLMIAGIGAVHAQTVDEIINKYITALGGKEKLDQIKTISLTGTVQVMGNEGTSSTVILNGKGYRLESDVNGQKMIQVLTDKGGWQVNPYMGATKPSPLPDELYKQSRGQIDFPGALYNYAAKGNKVELVGKDGNTFKLKITNPDAGESYAYIDTTTFYLTKISKTGQMMGQSMEINLIFSNFKKGDMDITFPYSTEISYGGQFSVVTTVNKLELNKPVDPAIFDMPKS